MEGLLDREKKTVLVFRQHPGQLQRALVAGEAGRPVFFWKVDQPPVVARFRQRQPLFLGWDPGGPCDGPQGDAFVGKPDREINSWYGASHGTL